MVFTHHRSSQLRRLIILGALLCRRLRMSTQRSLLAINPAAISPAAHDLLIPDESCRLRPRLPPEPQMRCSLSTQPLAQTLRFHVVVYVAGLSVLEM